jgi:molybdopterin molybdotransferase
MRTFITSAQALEIIRRSIRPLGPVSRTLEHALGRVLVEDVRADADVPGFDNSSMDGFALAADEDSPGLGDPYRVVGESVAGRPYAGSVGAGEAVRIMTGAKIPVGASAVIELERVAESDGMIRLNFVPEVGRNIRRAGEDLRRGTIALQRGLRLRPAHLGVLASLGRSSVAVAPAPRVAVVTTGSELVDPHGSLRDGQIFNSSAVVVPGMLREAGADVLSVRSIPDDENSLRSAFQDAATSDLLITTGGVSVGAHDLVLDILRSMGVDVLFWKVRIKPGLPLAFGQWPDGRPVICLPGNPVSTGVTFQQFVRPALDALEGATTASTVVGTARLEHEMRKSDGKRHFSRGIASRRDGLWSVRTTGSQSSGMLSSLASANCLIIIPEEVERLSAGDIVEIQWL